MSLESIKKYSITYSETEKPYKNKYIKQFVVTNCSKEQPGSIVNETLKNGILIPIDISKESIFYANFRYISFIR